MLFAIVQGVVTGTMYGLFALGIVLVYRGTKVINFAAPAIGSLGLFITHELHVERDVAWITAASIGLLVAAGTTALFELLIVRRMHDATPLSIAVATIGLMLLIISTELAVFGGAPRNLTAPISGGGFTLLGVRLTIMTLLSIAIAAGIGLGLAQFLRRTDFGLGVQAAAMDAQAVRLVGLKLDDVNQFVWVVGALISVIAALLVIPSIGAFGAGTVTKLFFVPALAAALIGGLDNLSGAFVGGLVMGQIVELSKFAFLGNNAVTAPQHYMVLAAIVAVLLFAPRGVLTQVRLARAAREVGS